MCTILSALAILFLSCLIGHLCCLPTVFISCRAGRQHRRDDLRWGFSRLVEVPGWSDSAVQSPGNWSAFQAQDLHHHLSVFINYWPHFSSGHYQYHRVIYKEYSHVLGHKWMLPIHGGPADSQQRLCQLFSWFPFEAWSCCRCCTSLVTALIPPAGLGTGLSAG